MSKRYASNGPKAYARLIEQSVSVNPLAYAYLVTAMEDGIKLWYENRHDIHAKRLEQQKDGNLFVNPDFEMRTYEQLHELMQIARDAADGVISSHKVDYVQELRKREGAEPKD